MAQNVEKRLCFTVDNHTFWNVRNTPSLAKMYISVLIKPVKSFDAKKGKTTNFLKYADYCYKVSNCSLDRTNDGEQINVNNMLIT